MPQIQAGPSNKGDLSQTEQTFIIAFRRSTRKGLPAGCRVATRGTGKEDSEVEYYTGQLDKGCCCHRLISLQASVIEKYYLDVGSLLVQGRQRSRCGALLLTCDSVMQNQWYFL